MKYINSVLVFGACLMPGLLSFSCSDDSESGKDYVRFTADNKVYTYQFSDSLFQRCEYHVGGSEKYAFSFDETFKSNDNKFYSLTVEMFSLAANCPTTSLDNSTQIRLDLVKQNESKKFMDFISQPNIELTWSQKFEDSKVKVSGKFKGWLYQYYSTRPGLTLAPEPQLIDSVFVDDGEFQVSVHY